MLRATGILDMFGNSDIICLADVETELKKESLQRIMFNRWSLTKKNSLSYWISPQSFSSIQNFLSTGSNSFS